MLDELGLGLNKKNVLHNVMSAIHKVLLITQRMPTLILKMPSHFKYAVDIIHLLIRFIEGTFLATRWVISWFFIYLSL